jgi:hypothetical protein
VLRLTLLEPDIVEAILGGLQPAEMTLAGLMRPFPVGWQGHRGRRRCGTQACERLRVAIPRTDSTDSSVRASEEHGRTYPKTAITEFYP